MRLRKRLMGAGLLMVAVVMLVGIVWGATKPPEEKDAYETAVKQFKRHNYKSALASADEYLKWYPAGERVFSVKMLKGYCLTKLDRYSTAVKWWDAVLKEFPEAESNPKMHMYLGAMHKKHWNAAKALVAFRKAADLYKKAGKKAELVKALFELVEQRRRWTNYPDAKNWQQRRWWQVRDVIKTYDEIVTVNLSADNNVRALRDAARYLLDCGHHIQSGAQEKQMVVNNAPLGLTPVMDKGFKAAPEAIKLLRRIVKEYPTHRLAARSQYEVGQVLEGRLSEFLAALDDYQLVLKKYPASKWVKNAKERIEHIKAPRIGLRIPGPAKPGEKPRMAWNIRNVKKVQFTAWKVNLFELLRKVEQLNALSKFKPGDRKSVATWSFDTPDADKHKWHRGGPDGNKLGLAVEAPMTKSGAYVVRAVGVNPDKKGYTATALVLVSRMAVVSKSGREKGLFFAADSITGKPVPGTNVLVQRLIKHVNNKPVYEYVEGEVRENGTFEQKWRGGAKRTYWNRNLVVIVGAKDDYSWLGANFHWYWYGYSDPHRVYGYTERPVYRPGQAVNFKQVIRKYVRGEYQNVAKTKCHVTITDPRNNEVYKADLVTNDFGSISGSFKIPATDPPLGVYNIRVRVGGRIYRRWQNAGSRFRVEEYKKPEYKVTIATAKDQYKLGDKMEVTLNGRYYFGAPVVGAKVTYEVHRSAYHRYWRPFRRWGWYYSDKSFSPWYRYRRSHRYGYRRDKVAEGSLVTNAEGNAVLNITTVAFEKTPDQDVQYHITAKMVDASRREIVAKKSIKVTHKAFYIYPEADRSLYGPGDRVRLKIIAKNANGAPVSFDGLVEMREVTYKTVELGEGKTRKDEVLGRKINLPGGGKVAVKNGQGEFTFKVDEEGYFKLIVKTTDAWGGAVEGGAYAWVAEKTGEFAHYNYGSIEIVPDKDTYLEGETAKVLINTKFTGSYVLLTGEGDDLYFHQIVYVPKKSKVVKIPVTAALSPNFYLTATLVRNDQLHADKKEVVVPPTRKFVKITIETPKKTFLPQEEADLVITATDWEGKPVEAELSVGFVDSSVFYIQQPFRENVQKVFYGQKRYLRVRTTSSYSFRSYSAGRGASDGELNKYDRQAEQGVVPSAPSAKSPMEPRRVSKAMADKKEGGEPEFKEAEVRKEFPDTVFWAAHVTTDKFGKAKVHVKFPDSLTTWRLTTVGFTKSTQVGEAEIDIITKKNVIVRLQAPRFFVEKDLVTLSAIAHNYLPTAKTTRVVMEVSEQLGILGVVTEASASIDPAAAPVRKLHADVEIPPNGEVRVDFLCRVLIPGEVTVIAKALTDTESDAMQKSYPVLEYGAEKFLAYGGVLREKQGDGVLDIAFHVPEAIKRKSQSLEVKISPSIAAVMLDALPYLLDYPYGCTEQTMSRFMPLVVTARTLQKMGVTLEDIKAKVAATGNAFKDKAKRSWYRRKNAPVYDTAEMNKMIAAGLKRLKNLQHSDGGWGWWKNDSANPYMTAYVVYGLAMARDADVKLPAGMIERGVECLAKRVSNIERVSRYWYDRDDVNVRACMLHSIAIADAKRLGKLAKLIGKIYEDRDELTDYGRSLLAITLQKIGKKKEARIVVENLENTAREDKETDTVSWGKRNYWYWYNGGVESTAAALRAMIAITPNNARITKAVTWLVRNRRGSRWFSTKDTAFAVLALAEYLNTTNELNPDQTVEVTIDGRLTKTFKITKENMWSFDATFAIAADQLAPGEHTVKVTRKGTGNAYVAAYVKYFTREDPIKGAGNEIFVDRSYFRKTPKTVTKTRRVWDPKLRKQVQETYKAREFDYAALADGDELKSGDLVEVRLKIKSLNNYEYLIFEDFKPAGLEATQIRSGHASGIWANMEMRDTRVAFFCTYLTQGTHTVKYELRAEIPGTFHALPHKAGAMYSPTVRCISDSFVLSVKD